MKRIKLLILNDGSTVAGEDNCGCDSKHELKNPVILLPNPQNGSVSFFPYLQFASEDVVDLTDATRHVLTPSNEIEQAYRHQFGAGLVIPPQHLNG